MPPQQDGLVRDGNVNPQAVFQLPWAVEQSIVCEQFPDWSGTGDRRIAFIIEMYAD